MKKVHYYLFLMGFCALFSVLMPQADALDYPIAVNYGKIQPVEITALNQILPFSLSTEKTDGLLLETAGLTGANFRQLLPANRMKLSVGDRSYPVTNSSLTVVFTERQKKTSVLSFTLNMELIPSDLPDKYTGTLIIRPWSDTPQGQKWNNTITAQVTVEVKPWIKLNCDRSELTLESTDYSGKSIQNEQPLLIKIASNTNWMLYCQLNTSGPELIPVIKVNTPTPAGIQTFNNVTGFDNYRKNLAAGRTTTVNGKYWCELSLTIAIKNVMNYPNGKYLIPLRFGAEFWNAPTN